MKAFLVSLNGTRVCLAGLNDASVMGMALDTTPQRGLKLNVGGLDAKTNEFVRWDTPQVNVGDELTIKIVEVDAVDPESARYLGTDEHGE